METYVGGGIPPSFLISALAGEEWSASFALFAKYN
jgi:hypothetical protein